MNRKNWLIGVGLALALFLSWGIVRATESGSPAEGPIRLVHDFFPGEFEGGEPPTQLTKLGNVLFFAASDLDTGRNVWRSDGTPAGTRRVSFPGGAGDEARILGRVGQRVLWSASTAGTPSLRVLVSAGPRGDGVVLHNHGPRNKSSAPGLPKVLGQRFFFQDCTATGCTIWSTDGTPTGTGPVPALASPSTDQEIVGTFADRWLVFRSKQALYAYDVALERVRLLLPSGARRLEMYPAGDTLFLLTRHDRSKLWASRLDSPRASQLFASTLLGVSGWSDGRLYFITENFRLWSTEGRPGSTRRYANGHPEPYATLADRLGTLGPITFLPVPGYYSGGLFAAYENRSQLREIHHTCSGKYECLGSSMSAVTVAGDQAFLEIDGFLWQSDGNPQGTKPHKTLGRADPSTFRVVGDRLVLGATSRQGEQQLWETDGTVQGTRALSDGDLDRPFKVQGPPMPFAGTLFVAAERKPVGQQLWRVAEGRATPLTRLRHLASGLSPYLAIPLGDRLVLSGSAYEWFGFAGDGSNEKLPVYNGYGCSIDNLCPIEKVVLEGRLLVPFDSPALWSTDGTVSGTRAVLLEGGSEIPWIAALGRWGDRALILDGGGGLWTSDGSSARLFAQLPSDPEVYWGDQPPIGPPLALGPLAFLFRRVPLDGDLAALELWRTDGTAAGTLRLASLPFDKNATPFPNPALVGGRLFFRFRGTLWVSDGSASGTRPLPDQPPGGTFALAAGTTTLYAAAGNPETGPETLWAIDPGTLEASLLATSPWIAGGYVGQPLGSIQGNTLFFQAADENDVTRWWVTEGTPQGTHPLPEPLASNTTAEFFTAGDRRYFAACDPEHGCELWSADRLGEDTRLVQDLWPGPRSSDPEILTVTEDAILLAATEPNVGRELWKIDLSEIAPYGVKRATPTRPLFSKTPEPRQARPRALYHSYRDEHP